MYLGIDLGTGSVKVMLLERDGSARTASKTYPVTAPVAGHAESDPDHWVQATVDALAELGDLSAVRGIGFSGQMHGVVLVTGRVGTPASPVGPAVLWADGRGAAVLDDFSALPADSLKHLANRPVAGMAGTTLVWMKRHTPTVLKQASTFLFPKDFVRSQLTGDRLSDHSDASGSLLYDFATRDWAWDTLQRLDVPRSLMPQLALSTDRAGTVSAAGAARFGLPEGVPVAVGAGDTPAAMVGTGLTDPAVAQVSVGTAAQVARAESAAEPVGSTPELNLFEGAHPDLRYRVAAMLNGGLALEWVRDRLGFQWAELYARLEAKDTADSPDLWFLPHLTGERTPYMNPEARGAWVGLGLHHTNDDLAHAALYGVACSVRLGLETLERHGGPVRSVRLVGGSARFPYWRRILSTVFDRPLEVTEERDGSARGAALLGATVAGDTGPSPAAFDPDPSPPIPWKQEYYYRFKELYRAING